MCAIPGDDRLGLRPGSSRYQAKMAYIPGGDCVCIWNGRRGRGSVFCKRRWHFVRGLGSYLEYFTAFSVKNKICMFHLLFFILNCDSKNIYLASQLMLN